MNPKHQIHGERVPPPVRLVVFGTVHKSVYNNAPVRSSHIETPVLQKLLLRRNTGPAQGKNETSLQLPAEREKAPKRFYHETGRRGSSRAQTLCREQQHDHPELPGTTPSRQVPEGGKFCQIF